MANQITYGDPSRQAILRGVNSLANAVKVTLGPRGRNVILDRKFGSPTITKDGVTVAKEIDLKDALENMGAQMVKEVASKTSDVAGDGTTTATELAQAIYREGAKNVTAGANPMANKRGIGHAIETNVASLKTQAKPVSGPMIAQGGNNPTNPCEASRAGGDAHTTRNKKGREGRTPRRGRGRAGKAGPTPRRGGEVPPHAPQGGGGHKFRPGLPPPIFPHSQRTKGIRPGNP